MSTLAVTAARNGPGKELVQAGETFGRTVRYGAGDIAAFAAACRGIAPPAGEALAPDGTPDGETQTPPTVACAHVSSMLIGLAASHLSRRSDGVARQMLELHFNFAFKAPIHADEDVHLQWKVSSVQWSARLGGCLAQLDGTAATLRSGVALVARGTVLVREGTTT